MHLARMDMEACRLFKNPAGWTTSESVFLTEQDVALRLSLCRSHFPVIRQKLLSQYQG